MPTEVQVNRVEDDPETQRNLMAMDPESYSSNQRQTLPYYAGEEKLAGAWIGAVYSQFTKEAPLDRPSKK